MHPSSPLPPPDYDSGGAQGVSSGGGLCIARYLLHGGSGGGQQGGEGGVALAADDADILERMAELLQARRGRVGNRAMQSTGARVPLPMAGCQGLLQGR
jgi:hypothetical protein